MINNTAIATAIVMVVGLHGTMLRNN